MQGPHDAAQPTPAGMTAVPPPAELSGPSHNAHGHQAPDDGTAGVGSQPQQGAAPAAPLQVPQQQPAAAEQTGAAAQRPEPPDAQQPQLAQREAEATATLEAILTRVSGLDTDGWFYAPVREEDAPNYSKIIKQPMCFQLMLGKIRGRQYVNWNEIVRDFELICSNAMKYNQKRSKIHKLALVMLRAGKKLLGEVEAEGRQAIAELHAGRHPLQQDVLGLAGWPGMGMALLSPGAGMEPQDSQAVPSSLLRSGMASVCGLAAASGAAGLGAGAGAIAHLHRSLSIMDTATTSDTSHGAGAGRGAGAFHASDLDLGMGQLEGVEGGYSSYSDTDLEEEGEQEQQEQQHGHGHGASAGSLLEQLLHGGEAALVRPSSGLPGWWQEAAGEGQQAQQGAAAAPLPQVGQPRAWKQSRRSVEWRIRWLELRMCELRQQRRRYVARHLQQAQAQAAQGGEEGAKPSLPPEQWHPHAQHLALPQHPLPELQLPGLLSHPFFEEHSMAAQQRREDQQQRQQQQQSGGAECAPLGAVQQQQQEAAGGAEPAEHASAEPAALAPPPTPSSQPPPGAAAEFPAVAAVAAGGEAALQLDDPNYPARAHAALGLLERRLSALRQEILSLQSPGSALLSAGGAARGAGHGAAGHLLLLPRGARGGSLGRPRGRAPGSGGGGLGSARSRSGGLSAKQQQQHAWRDDRLGKRRRAELDLNDIVTPGVLGAPKYVERVQVKTIDTPKVRLVPAEEVKKRESALAEYASSLREGQPEAQAAEALAAVCPAEDGASSEEEISDEAYAARHKALEEEERQRYQSYAGQLAGQRNKKPTKATKERGKVAKPGRLQSAPYHISTPAPTLGLAIPHQAGGATPAAPSSAPAALGLPRSAVASATIDGAASGLPTPASVPGQEAPGGQGSATPQAPPLALPAHPAAAAGISGLMGRPHEGSVTEASEALALALPVASGGASPALPYGLASPSPASPATAAGPSAAPPTAASAAALPPPAPAAVAVPPSGAAGAGSPGPSVARTSSGPWAVPVAALHEQPAAALQGAILRGPAEPGPVQSTLGDGRGTGRPRGRPRLKPKS